MLRADHVAEIIELEKRAHESDLEGDRCRWEASRLIVAELDGGKSQHRLAGEIGKDQSHVSRMAKVWRTHGSDDLGHRPWFNTAYQAAKRSSGTVTDGLPTLPNGSHTRRGLSMLDTVPVDADASVLRITSALRDIANGDHPERAFMHACQAVTDLVAR